MDWWSIGELAVHYFALFVVLAVSARTIGQAVPGLSVWIQMAIAMIIAYLYLQLVRLVGVAPESWQR